MTKAQAEKLILAFSEAAERLDIQVRTERLQGVGGVPVSSGLAQVEDSWVVFLEKRQPPRERLSALVEALDRFDLSGLDLAPEAAAYLDKINALIE